MKNKFIRAMAIGSIILIVSVLAGLLFGSVQSALAKEVEGSDAVIAVEETIREYYEPEYYRDQIADPPFLMDTTAYYYGDTTYTGARARKGIAAAKKEWVGLCAVLYQAVLTDNGYKIGDLIGYYEILDIGYGAESGDGIPSKVRPDKWCQGTIERGECIDIYRDTEAECYEWMAETDGKVFVQLVAAVG